MAGGIGQLNMHVEMIVAGVDVRGDRHATLFKRGHHLPAGALQPLMLAAAPGDIERHTGPIDQGQGAFGRNRLKRLGRHMVGGNLRVHHPPVEGGGQAERRPDNISPYARRFQPITVECEQCGQLSAGGVAAHINSFGRAAVRGDIVGHPFQRRNAVLHRRGKGHMRNQPVGYRYEDYASRHQGGRHEAAPFLVAARPSAAVHENQNRTIATGGVGRQPDVELLPIVRAIGDIEHTARLCRRSARPRQGDRSVTFTGLVHFWLGRQIVETHESLTAANVIRLVYSGPHMNENLPWPLS